MPLCDNGTRVEQRAVGLTAAALRQVSELVRRGGHRTVQLAGHFGEMVRGAGALRQYDGDDER